MPKSLAPLALFRHKEQPNIAAVESPEQKINKQKEIVAMAENNVRKSLEALEKLGINVPEYNGLANLDNHIRWM